VGKFFAAIEQQDFFHEKSRKVGIDGGSLTISLARNKRSIRKIHLTYTHESTSDCCHKLAPIMTV
jgi:hypothetical protein